jgi:serine protease Do
VVVEDFPPQSAAQKAGLRRHDVIVAIEGTPIERVGHLQRLVALRQPADVIAVSVIRYGEPLEFRVRLMESPGNGPAAAIVDAPPRVQGIGLELEELTPLLARQLGYERAGGALIARVLPGSAAARKEIGAHHRITEINGQAVDSVATARQILRTAASGQVVSLLVEYPDGRTYIANVRMP